jgi:hypothetical protein
LVIIIFRGKPSQPLILPMLISQKKREGNC